jgi:hypothetical protein
MHVVRRVYANTAVLSLAGTHPFKYTIEPALPDGLELDETTGEIRGVPGLPQVYILYIYFTAPLPAVHGFMAPWFKWRRSMTVS